MQMMGFSCWNCNDLLLFYTTLKRMTGTVQKKYKPLSLISYKSSSPADAIGNSSALFRWVLSHTIFQKKPACISWQEKHQRNLRGHHFKKLWVTSGWFWFWFFLPLDFSFIIFVYWLGILSSRWDLFFFFPRIVLDFRHLNFYHLPVIFSLSRDKALCSTEEV